jgi:phosphoribosylcarboxyaminoimidazole (NCAIR) mutase
MATPLVVIFMGSKSDLAHCEKIEKSVKVLLNSPACKHIGLRN